MNIDLIKKIIDNKISRGLDKNLPDAHVFGWNPDPPITEYELVNVKLDNNEYRCECAYDEIYFIDKNKNLNQKNVRRIKFIIIGLEEYNLWVSENREFLINKIL
jgi:hypothetical protein